MRPESETTTDPATPPDPTTPADPRGARAWGVVLALVLLVECLVVLFGPAASPLERGERFYPAWRAPTFEESIVHWQVLRTAAIDTPAQLLVLGDSTALMGVPPADVASGLAASGLAARQPDAAVVPVENLALLGFTSTHGIADMYAWYRRFHPAPDGVVVHVGAFAFLLDDREVAEIELLDAMRRWMGTSQGLRGFWPATRLRGGTFGDPSDYDERGLAQARGPLPSDAATRDALVRGRGFVAEPRREADWRQVVATPQHVRDDALAGLDRLLEATAADGTRVWIVRAPLPDPFAWPAFEAQVEAQGERVREHVARWPHVRVMSPWVRWRALMDFATFEHLNEEGARRNGAELGAWLAEELAR